MGCVWFDSCVDLICFSCICVLCVYCGSLVVLGVLVVGLCLLTCLVVGVSFALLVVLRYFMLRFGVS